MGAKLITRCVNAHDRCDGGPCDYCEPVTPLRTEDGRFASFTHDFAEPPAGREACDLCGDWHTELRLIDHDGWTADTFTCRECFGTHDGPDFTDLQLIQEAVRHV